MLRGSRDFEDRADYERFLRELLAGRGHDSPPNEPGS